MQMGRVLAAMAVAAAFASAAEAQVTVYDGLSYPQFKSILATTKLGLTEQVTTRGNRFLLVMVPGWTAPFVATSASCPAGQDAPCDGFAFFYIDAGRSVSGGAMGKFNEGNFIKMFPAGETGAPIVKGDYYARGGIVDQNVLSAGAYYTGVLQSYLGSTGTSVMNAPAQVPALTFTDASQPQKFFAALASRGAPKPAPAGAKTAAMEAMVDALVAK